jgi:hypothetical protein
VANSTKPKQPASSASYSVLAIVVAALLIGGAVWFFFLRGPAQPPAVSALTQAAKAYVKNLGLSEVNMEAKENYMKHTLVEITGKLTNKGGRTLRLVEINCVFYDPYGQLLLRERVPIVKRSGAPPLKPGETRAFRLPFDAIPSGWNQTLPQLVIARIDFED